jgi:hypothetical protein
LAHNRKFGPSQTANSLREAVKIKAKTITYPPHQSGLLITGKPQKLF